MDPKEARDALQSKLEAALDRDGFGLSPLDSIEQRQDLRKIETFLKTANPEQLGKGKDVTKRYGQYNSLKLASAWRVHHPNMSRKYEAAKASVEQNMSLLTSKGLIVHGEELPGMPTLTQAAAAGFSLTSATNERFLLHGTSPDVLLAILTNGLNERYSGSNAGTAFGEGVYLAEDVGKTDQYGLPDVAYDAYSDLHKRIYSQKYYPHQGSVFYVLVCRALLGYPARTQDTTRQQTGQQYVPSMFHMDTGEPIYPVNEKEFAAIPSISPPITYHSLIAELGPNIKRYREFIFTHGDQVFPEYLIAYHRCWNGQVVTAAQ